MLRQIFLTPFLVLRNALLCFFLVEISLLFFCAAPIIFDQGLNIFDALTLVAIDLTLWFSSFYIIYVSFVSVPQTLLKKFSPIKIIRFVYVAFIFLALNLFFFLYIADWLFFIISYLFFGLNTFIIIFTRISLIFKHAIVMRSIVFVSVLALSFGCSVLLMYSIYRKRTICLNQANVFRRLDKLLIAIVASSVVLTTIGISNAAFQPTLVKKKIWYSFNKNTSPLTALIGEYYRNQKVSSMLFSNNLLNKEYRAQIPLHQYVAQIDRGKIKKYNVLLILIESLRADQLLKFGGHREVMPNLESISNEAYCFINGFAQSSHSDYSDPCPLSSHYPLRSLYSHVYPKKITYPNVLVYDILKELNYKTAIFSSQNEYWGNLFYYLNKPSLDRYLHAENYEGETYVPYNDTMFEMWMKGNKRAGKIDDRYTVAEAVDWLSSMDRSTPFFMYLNLQNSHIPFQLPEDFPKNYSKDVNLDFTISFEGFPRERVQDVMDLYADTLSYVDHQLGKVFDYLKENDLWDHTIVIVSGDTGQAFYEHGYAAHGNNLFNETIKVPILFKVPGRTGEVIDTFMEHIDIPPTLFHFLNISNHPSFQGKNVFQKNDTHPPLFFVSHAIGRKYAIIKDWWKLIYDQTIDESFLFNLREDPGEKNNLVLSEPELSNELLDYLKEWIASQINYYKNNRLLSESYPPSYRLKNPGISKNLN